MQPIQIADWISKLARMKRPRPAPMDGSAFHEAGHAEGNFFSISAGNGALHEAQFADDPAGRDQSRWLACSKASSFPPSAPLGE